MFFIYFYRRFAPMVQCLTYHITVTNRTGIAYFALLKFRILNLWQLITIVIFLHQVFPVNGLIGKFVAGVVPYQLFGMQE